MDEPADPLRSDPAGWRWGKRLVHPVGTSVVVLAAAAWLLAYNPVVTKPPAPTPPAKVDKVVKEDELATIKLSEDSEKKLGLQVGAVVAKPARRVRVYGGDVTVPVGKAVLVAAPLGGLLRPPEGGVPKVGALVKKGQPVLSLLPLFSPDSATNLARDLAKLEEEVQTAEVSVQALLKPFERAQQLVKERIGSQKDLDLAQAAYEGAVQAKKSAVAQRDVLAKFLKESGGGTAAPITVEAPEDGMLRNVSALAGQSVPAGAALFEVVDLTTVWVRVPLPVGDLDDISRAEPARVGKLGVANESKVQAANPVAAPPSANALAATIDLFYELANPDGALIPGQRLGVQIPLADSRESLTLPRSAIATDIHGGTWVYEPTAARTFVRRRVVVAHVLGDDAVLSSGPAAGTKVVVQGAQGLFGAETGFVK